MTEKPYENNVVFFLLRFCNEHSKMAKDEAIKSYESEILFRKNINELIKRQLMNAFSFNFKFEFAWEKLK